MQRLRRCGISCRLNDVRLLQEKINRFRTHDPLDEGPNVAPHELGHFLGRLVVLTGDRVEFGLDVGGLASIFSAAAIASTISVVLTRLRASSTYSARNVSSDLPIAVR